jgi:hypothetical protein
MDNLMNVNASLQIQDYMSENFEFGKNFHQPFTQKLAPKKKPPTKLIVSGSFTVWAQLGSNHRPPDYECSFFELLFDPKNPDNLNYL